MTDLVISLNDNFPLADSGGTGAIDAQPALEVERRYRDGVFGSLMWLGIAGTVKDVHDVMNRPITFLMRSMGFTENPIATIKRLFPFRIWKVVFASNGHL